MGVVLRNEGILRDKKNLINVVFVLAFLCLLAKRTNQIGAPCPCEERPKGRSLNWYPVWIASPFALPCQSISVWGAPEGALFVKFRSFQQNNEAGHPDATDLTRDFSPGNSDAMDILTLRLGLGLRLGRVLGLELGRQDVPGLKNTRVNFLASGRSRQDVADPSTNRPWKASNEKTRRSILEARMQTENLTRLLQREKNCGTNWYSKYCDIAF